MFEKISIILSILIVLSAITLVPTFANDETKVKDKVDKDKAILNVDKPLELQELKELGSKAKIVMQIGHRTPSNSSENTWVVFSDESVIIVPFSSWYAPSSKEWQR